MGLKKFIIETLLLFFLAMIIVLPIRYFVFQPFFVKFSSMEPNFHNGDYLIVDELSYRFRTPERGEVIVFHYPLNPKELFIKRIIGFPEEIIKIKDGVVFIYENGEDRVLKENYLPENNFTPGNITITLKPDEYFVMGDNREHSSDSRMWGPIKESNIIGKVIFRPFSFVELQDFVKQFANSSNS